MWRSVRCPCTALLPFLVLGCCFPEREPPHWKLRGAGRALALSFFLSAAGVYGQVHKLARVTNDEYKLAMTVAMGKDFESVIVDTGADLLFLPAGPYCSLQTSAAPCRPLLLPALPCATSHGAGRAVAVARPARGGPACLAKGAPPPMT